MAITREPATSAGPAPRRAGARRRRLERALVALEALVSVSGLGGGAYLMARPTTAMPMRLLAGTGFASWRLPGVALFVLVGVAPGIVAVAATRGLRAARVGHLLVGAGLVAWIVVEMLWVVVTWPLQIAYASMGVAIVVLALLDRRCGGGAR